jgi:PHD/YefM family antitoxin component YafN of YafNO toxin-antitoxin module
MNTYTYSEARQKLASLLEQAAKYGEVRIKRRDGQVFVIKPQSRKGSPLDVEGIKTKLNRREILQSIEEGRKTFSEKKPRK